MPVRGRRRGSRMWGLVRWHCCRVHRRRMGSAESDLHGGWRRLLWRPSCSSCVRGEGPDVARDGAVFSCVMSGRRSLEKGTHQSMDGGWPGRMCALAHLCPNLQELRGRG